MCDLGEREALQHVLLDPERPGRPGTVAAEPHGVLAGSRERGEVGDPVEVAPGREPVPPPVVHRTRGAGQAPEDGRTGAVGNRERKRRAARLGRGEDRPLRPVRVIPDVVHQHVAGGGPTFRRGGPRQCGRAGETGRTEQETTSCQGMCRTAIGRHGELLCRRRDHPELIRTLY